MKSRNWQLPPSNGNNMRITRTALQTTECEPEVIEKKNGEKIVVFPGFKGVAFVTDEEFYSLVERAKIGAFDGVIHELFHND